VAAEVWANDEHLGEAARAAEQVALVRLCTALFRSVTKSEAAQGLQSCTPGGDAVRRPVDRFAKERPFLLPFPNPEQLEISGWQSIRVRRRVANVSSNRVSGLDLPETIVVLDPSRSP
jgi:hypothetical protein